MTARAAAEPSEPPDQPRPDAGVATPTLRTLGGLELEGAAFSRPKPLLLLTYVALEGRQPRRHLAELFFADADHPLQSLSVALSRLRRAVGPAVRADERTVEARLTVDTAAFLEALDRGDLEGATARYRGPFLEGVASDGLGVEVEEWLYATREFLAEQLREARLRRAEREAAAGRLSEAGRFAEAAWETAGAPEPDAPQLHRLHQLLLASARPLAARVAAAAREWGIDVASDAAAARTRFAAAAETSASTLPAAAGGFVGRERERAELRGALLDPEGRVVTIVGPGGVGKTRLALHVAHELETAEPFEEGARFVALEDVMDPARVAGRVAHALGVTLDGPDAPVERLVRALRDRRTLVLLDNAEHVLDGVASLLSAAAEAPRVRWLVTSRERLQLRDEFTVPLDGLSLPAAGEHDPQALRASDAVTLFLQRVRRVHGAVDDDALADVARVCRAVGGWPLALEIGASLTRVMGVGELAEELERRLDLLVDPSRDTPDRHHSVLGALASTWERLAEADREALARLSVFRGGFGRADAEAVAGVGIARVARLVDRALVRVAGPGRFELHPLVWRYASDRRAERDDGAAVTLAHARHYLALAADAAEELRGSGRDEAAARLALDHANVRDAWLAAIASGDDVAWGGAALAVGRYFEAVARYREGLAWLAPARERARLAPVDDDVHAAVALYEGLFLARLARFDDAARAIAPAVTARDPVVRAAAHETIALYIELWRGRYAAAGRHLREAEALHRELGDAAGAARSAFVLANITWIAGDWDESFCLLREAREAFRGLADLHGEIITTAGLGVVEMDRGDLAAARRHLERAAARAGAVTSEHLRATVEVNLAHARLLQGDTDGLAEVFDRGLAVFERVGDDPWVTETAALAARLAAREGRAPGAAHYVVVGLDAAVRSGHLPSVAEAVSAAAEAVAEASPDDAARLLLLVRDHPRAYASTRNASAMALSSLGRGEEAPERVTVEALIHPGSATTRVDGAMGEDPLLAAAAALLHEGRLPSGRAFAR